MSTNKLLAAEATMLTDVSANSVGPPWSKFLLMWSVKQTEDEK